MSHVGFVEKEGSTDNRTIFSTKERSRQVLGVEKDQDDGSGDGDGRNYVISSEVEDDASISRRRKNSVEDDAINAKTTISGASKRPSHRNAVLCEKVVQSPVFGPSKQPRWISKDWHIFERKTHTFTVGSDIGCDILIHKDHNLKSNRDISDLPSRSSSPYWTLVKYDSELSESSSSSTVSDVFWLQNFTREPK